MLSLFAGVLRKMRLSQRQETRQKDTLHQNFCKCHWSIIALSPKCEDTYAYVYKVKIIPTQLINPPGADYFLQFKNSWTTTINKPTD